MLLPRHMAGDLIRFQAAQATDMQEKIQRGCSCCGWEGDPFLHVRAVPQSKGGGWCVIQADIGRKPTIIWLSDADERHAIDHRVITYLQEAKKNAQQMDVAVKAMEAHDAKVELDTRKKEAELNSELSKMTMGFMKKNDMLPIRHKIDKKKD